MKILLRSRPERLRKPASFTVSAGIHVSVVAWFAFWPVAPPESPRPLYDLVQPHLDHLIWYKLSDRLPDIRPAKVRPDPRPPRARKRFEQTIVAGAKDNARPPQLIWGPQPEIRTSQPVPLPNLIAVAPVAPRLARRFIPPPAPKMQPPAAPALPEAPQIAAARPSPGLAIPTPRVRPPALPFHRPAAPRTADPTPLALPAAPEIQPATTAPALPSALARIPRGFVAPPRRPLPPAAPAVIDAEPPTLPAGDRRPPEASLAIAGLEPARVPEVPVPPGSRAAAFSGGPQPHRNGGNAGSADAMLEVPGLLVEGGARENQPILVSTRRPTSPESLAAATHAANGGVPRPTSAARPATRVAAAPDPRLEGRVVYTMAIQMPNITSHSGSWLVWFAEHETPPGSAPQEVQPPQPLRKVDPKYIVSAVEERVEGKVRLWGVIGKDGHVGSVTLLSHLDDRLDRSAEEALSKWLFQPALYNGRPVEVDAVFEVPFRLAPRPAR